MQLDQTELGLTFSGLVSVPTDTKVGKESSPEAAATAVNSTLLNGCNTHGSHAESNSSMHTVSTGIPLRADGVPPKPHI